MEIYATLDDGILSTAIEAQGPARLPGSDWQDGLAAGFREAIVVRVVGAPGAFTKVEVIFK